MRLIKIFSLLVSLLFVACSDSYEQHYDSYNDFNKVNQRNKSWFPDFIGSDAFNLKNESYLDSLCAFGMFNYTNDKYYDSIFASADVEKIEFSELNEKAKLHKDRKPKWFVRTDGKFILETIKIKRFYIAKDNAEGKIYFILSN